MPPVKIKGYTREGRPIVANEDGTYSTEETVTVEVSGKFLNIPTIYSGKRVTEDEAVKLLRDNNWKDPDTGMKIPIFDSLDQAEKAAQKRSKELGNELKGRGF